MKKFVVNMNSNTTLIPPESDEVRAIVSELEKNPRDVSLQRKLGLIRWNQRELVEAYIQFRKIHQIEPSNTESIFAMSAISLERKRETKAFELLFSIAFREEYFKKRGEAFDTFRLEKRFRDFPVPYNKVNWKDVFLELEKKIKVNAQYKNILQNEGNLCLTHKNYDKAVRLFSILCVLEPRNPLIRLCFASALSAKRNDKLAEIEFNEAILLEPKNPAGYKGLALLRARRGEIEKAKTAFEQVLQLNPDDFDAKTWLQKTG